MRRLLSGLSLLLVAASTALVIAGCGGLGTLERLFPPDTFGSGNTSPFIGQFKETSIAANGTTESCPATFSSGGTTYSCEAIVRLFVSDGTFQDSAPADQIGSGLWSVTGAVITITKNGVVASYTAGFAPDQSSFVLTSGALSQTWTRQ